MADTSNKIADLVNAVFHGQMHGLRFFQRNEREKLNLRQQDNKIEIWCAKRERWLRAKPEEVVRQLFLVWVQNSLDYKLERVKVEWPIQMGEDAERERADIVVFTDNTCTDPYIVFELKRPKSADGLAQLQSYLRWTGCFFGCWSNGDDHSFQLREEEPETRKAPYKYRDIGRLPKNGEDLDDILKPLTFAELKPIQNMRELIERLEDDALANAGVNAFEELFKLFFAKLHDEFRPKRKSTDVVEFRVPLGTPEQVYDRFNKLFQSAKARPNWSEIFDTGDVLKLRGDALKLCAAALEPLSLSHTDLDAVDAAFEYLVNPEQKGQKGQYFTPRTVIKMAVKMLNPDDGEKVIDPACGSAGFLIHTIRHVQQKNGWSLDKVYRYANDYLYAVDFDDRLKKVAKTMMIIAGDGKANVFGVNALDPRQWQNSPAAAKIGPFSKEVRDGDFDVVLTNPPFAGKVSGKSQLAAFDLYELALTGALKADEDEDENADEQEETEVKGKGKKRGKKTVGGMKRDVLFLERCLDLLKPGGRMAIVLPQGNLNNAGTRVLRDYVSRRARLLAVVGLPYNTFKPFTNTKTSVVFLQKLDEEAQPPVDDYEIFMAVSELSGKDNSGRYVYKTDDHGNYVDELGEPITESGRPPAVKHDLNEIADAFVAWGRGHKFSFLA